MQMKNMKKLKGKNCKKMEKTSKQEKHFHEFRLCYMKLCVSDNRYIMTVRLFQPLYSW